MITLNDIIFEQVIGKNGIYLINFTADWCQPCKAVASILAKLESQFPNVMFAKLNVDEAPKTGSWIPMLPARCQRYCS